MSLSSSLPLPALVGLDAAVQALLLLAVEPRLRGVVIAAPAGTGKSSLARGFQELITSNWKLEIDPWQHQSSISNHQSPFIELPPSADEDALLGGLDMQATLRAGRRVARAGLLARADGGVVYVDQINLVPDRSANLLLDALERGVARVEREGISLTAAARFTLLGSFDPAEGTPRRHLLDRVGLLVVLPSATDVGQRAEVVRRNIGDRRQGTGDRSRRETPPDPYEDELALMQGTVAAAREQLPQVRISDEQVTWLTGAAVAFGVEGHRADLFAVYAACAAAALDLRDAVEEDDLELAVRLIILPRATRVPIADERPPTNDEQAQPPEEPPPPDDQQSGRPGDKEQSEDERNREPHTQEPGTENEHETTDQQHDSETQNAKRKTQNLPTEQVLEALASELPLELDALPFRALRRGRSGSRGETSGTRGRHIRSAPGDVRRNRIDLAATLRAAVPWQQLRGQGTGDRGQGTGDRGAIPTSRALHLKGEDLRVKHFRSKAGALFCFAVDASGSMALHRMRQAKGAVHALLQQAYVHRDRVALIAFRGSEAELLLPPSQSVELARRALDLLPTGGGTPIAAALVRALEVAKQARGKGIFQTVLVLLTDGRANVGLRAERAGIPDELQAIARHVAEAGIRTIVVDTQRSYLSRGEAKKLADWLGGQYVYLPNAKGEQIAAVALNAHTR